MLIKPVENVIMKSLNHHNAEKKAIRAQSGSAKANVSCDVCSEEMYYTDLNVMLASNPPMMSVACYNEKCKDCNKIKYKVC